MENDPFIDDFPLEMVIFYSYVNVYLRFFLNPNQLVIDDPITTSHVKLQIYPMVVLPYGKIDY